jgi:hypothetical protein
MSYKFNEDSVTPELEARMEDISEALRYIAEETTGKKAENFNEDDGVFGAIAGLGILISELQLKIEELSRRLDKHETLTGHGKEFHWGQR